MSNVSPKPCTRQDAQSLNVSCPLLVLRYCKQSDRYESLIKGDIFQVFVRLTAKLRTRRLGERLAACGDGELVFQVLCHLVDMRWMLVAW